MLVLIKRNYEFPDLFRQTPGSKGKWGNIQFTHDDVKECDYVVVLNSPANNIKVKCRKDGQILIIQEPPYERNSYLKLHFRFYAIIISAFKSTDNTRILNAQAALPWHINKTYDELLVLPIEDMNGKKDSVSFITGSGNIYPEHKVRLDFIEYMKAQAFHFDLFGRGFRLIEDKFEGIYPYKYTIAAENYIGKDYFTEKISDVFLSWSMPIYYGCPNITDYFPAESMILVDLNKPMEALEKIKYAIENKLWDKNIEAIKRSRELVLNKYQLFPMIGDLIKDKFFDTEPVTLERVFLPHSGLTRIERTKEKIKRVLKKIVNFGNDGLL